MSGLSLHTPDFSENGSIWAGLQCGRTSFAYVMNAMQDGNSSPDGMAIFPSYNLCSLNFRDPEIFCKGPEFIT
jgi:hypothetical protein